MFCAVNPSWHVGVGVVVAGVGLDVDGLADVASGDIVGRVVVNGSRMCPLLCKRNKGSTYRSPFTGSCAAR